MITPLGNIRFTCSASEIAAVRFTLGLGVAFGVALGRGFGAALLVDVTVALGLGSQGIQVALRVELTRGRGVAVLEAPGRPLRIEIITWFSSSALTSMHV